MQYEMNSTYAREINPNLSSVGLCMLLVLFVSFGLYTTAHTWLIVVFLQGSSWRTPGRSELRRSLYAISYLVDCCIFARISLADAMEI